MQLLEVVLMAPKSKTSRASSQKTPNVYLWIPNLIGYGRIALTITAVYYAFSCWKTFVVCYSVGAILDLFDGMAARHFGQSSRFGAVLDMVTDRVGTNMLYIVLTALRPDLFFWFAMLAGADYSSHWAQMYASATTGTHHKVLDKDRNWLLRFYYGNKPFMFLNCVGQETFLIALYVYSQGVLVETAGYVMLAAAPFGGIKQIINLIQLADAMKQIVKVDIADIAK